MNIWQRAVLFIIKVILFKNTWLELMPGLVRVGGNWVMSISVKMLRPLINKEI